MVDGITNIAWVPICHPLTEDNRHDGTIRRAEMGFA